MPRPVVPIEEQRAQPACERTVHIVFRRIADVQRIARFASRMLERLAKNIGMRLFKTNSRRIENEVERVAQSDAREHVVEIAGPIRDDAEHQPAGANRCEQRPHLVVHAPPSAAENAR